MTSTMPSYLDYPVQVLFQICWYVSNPADLASLASFPTIRDRMTQFIQVYTSTDARAFEQFNGFVTRPLDAQPEEFTICLLEYERDKLHILRGLMDKCQELKQAKCLIGYKGGNVLDLCFGKSGTDYTLPSGSTVYIADAELQVKSNIVPTETNRSYHYRMDGVDYNGWNNNTGTLVGYGPKSVTIHGLKNTANLTVGLTLFQQIEVRALSGAGCDMDLPKFLNLELLEDMEIKTEEYEPFVTSYYSKGTQRRLPDIMVSTLSALTFPKLRTMTLYGVNLIKDLDLPMLESLALNMVPAQRSDNGLVSIPPTILNVKAPKCTNVKLSIKGPLMPKIKKLQVPMCDKFAFDIDPSVCDVIGHAVHNALFKLVAPPSVTDVRLQGVDDHWIDMKSLKDKRVERC